MRKFSTKCNQNGTPSSFSLRILGPVTPPQKCLSSGPDIPHIIQIKIPDFQPNPTMASTCASSAQLALPENQVGQPGQRMRMLKPWLDLAKIWYDLSMGYKHYLLQRRRFYAKKFLLLKEPNKHGPGNINFRHFLFLLMSDGETIILFCPKCFVGHNFSSQEIN